MFIYLIEGWFLLESLPHCMKEPKYLIYCRKGISSHFSLLSYLYTTVAGDYSEAMKCYLELGSTTSSFFSRPVANSVWDDKVNDETTLFIHLFKHSLYLFPDYYSGTNFRAKIFAKSLKFLPRNFSNRPTSRKCIPWIVLILKNILLYKKG